MLSYTVNRSYTVKDKWLSLMIPILVIGFSLTIIATYFHFRFLR